MRAENSSENGQAIIEFALLLPFLILLIVNVVNFGAFIYDWITVTNAARTGAQYMIMGGATLGMPSPPSEAQIFALVQNDVVSLPNSDGVQVRVCTNNKLRDPRVVCVGPGSNTAPDDPEPDFYVLGTVDVTYTYRPIIPLWDFPAMNIHATIPPLTLHRRSIMRYMQ